MHGVYYTLVARELASITGSGGMGLFLHSPFFPDPGVDLLTPGTSSSGLSYKTPIRREGVSSI